MSIKIENTKTKTKTKKQPPQQHKTTTKYQKAKQLIPYQQLKDVDRIKKLAKKILKYIHDATVLLYPRVSKPKPVQIQKAQQAMQNNQKQNSNRSLNHLQRIL